jgi:hypothetical protein
MKAANAAWRKCKTPEQREALISAQGVKESTRAAMMSLGQGDALFPSYSITNLGANIRRIEKRIAELSAPAPTMDPIDGGWFHIEVRADLNRVALKADRRVSDESFRYLRSAGWRWSPNEGAFLWNLNNRGIHNARDAATVLSREVAS